MFSVSGFVDPTLRKYDMAYVDTKADFVVGSCGQTVVLKNDAYVRVTRESGRADYQILYISKGRYSFTINGEKKIVTDGHAVLYRPNDVQNYGSIDNNDVEIFWTHFTGNKCDEILNELGFSKSGVYFVGSNDKFSLLYKWIIKEMQLKREGYLNIASDYFKVILQLMSRNNMAADSDAPETYFAEKAIIHFYRNFDKEISIDEYAKSLDITPSWFRKCFKKRTGVSPKQFINDIRLSYAREMLLTSDYKLAEIAERSGYENAYFFSRIFTKNTGCSPMQFRKNNSQTKVP